MTKRVGYSIQNWMFRNISPSIIGRWYDLHQWFPVYFALPVEDWLIPSQPSIRGIVQYAVGNRPLNVDPEPDIHIKYPTTIINEGSMKECMTQRLIAVYSFVSLDGLRLLYSKCGAMLGIRRQNMLCWPECMCSMSTYRLTDWSTDRLTDWLTRTVLYILFQGISKEELEIVSQKMLYSTCTVNHCEGDNSLTWW